MARATLCHTLATSLVKGDYTSMEVELREQMQQYVAVCGMKHVCGTVLKIALSSKASPLSTAVLNGLAYITNK